MPVYDELLRLTGTTVAGASPKISLSSVHAEAGVGVLAPLELSSIVNTRVVDYGALRFGQAILRATRISGSSVFTVKLMASSALTTGTFTAIATFPTISRGGVGSTNSTILGGSSASSNYAMGNRPMPHVIGFSMPAGKPYLGLQIEYSSAGTMVANDLEVTIRPTVTGAFVHSGVVSSAIAYQA